MPTLHLMIKGKVQGVFYRATAKETANKLGITGWIKNTVEGDVEAVVTGETAQLQTFVEWCKNGPERATVSHVIVTEKDETTFDEFSILRG